MNKPRRKHLNQLTDLQRQWLVERYACYGRTTEIREAFKKEFGVEVNADVARKYNLSHIRDDEHAKQVRVVKWMDIFRRTREAFQQSVNEIPIAQQAYRVQKLDEMFEEAMSRRNFRVAASLLEQAAKETGGAFTSKRQLEGSLEVIHEVVPLDIKKSTVAQGLRDAIQQALAAHMVALPAPEPDDQPMKIAKRA